MESDNSPSTRLIRSLKQRIDELVVQLSLGKAEAAEHVEEGKVLLRKKLEAARDGLSRSEAHRSLAAKLDHLRLQLTLGSMESRDAYEVQSKKIHHAIEEARKEFHHLDDVIREDLNQSADALQDKLNALALNLGIAALVAEDELKTRREELSSEAGRLATRLRELGSQVGEETETAAREARAAFDDIRDNLRRLLG